MFLEGKVAPSGNEAEGALLGDAPSLARAS